DAEGGAEGDAAHHGADGGRVTGRLRGRERRDESIGVFGQRADVDGGCAMQRAVTESGSFTAPGRVEILDAYLDTVGTRVRDELSECLHGVCPLGRLFAAGAASSGIAAARKAGKAARLGGHAERV